MMISIWYVYRHDMFERETCEFGKEQGHSRYAGGFVYDPLQGRVLQRT